MHTPAYAPSACAVSQVQWLYCNTALPSVPPSHNTTCVLRYNPPQSPACCNTLPAYCNTLPGHNTVQCIVIHSCLNSFPSHNTVIVLQYNPLPLKPPLLQYKLTLPDSQGPCHDTIPSLTIQLGSSPNQFCTIFFFSFSRILK